MNKHEVRTPEQALAYITDCTLATVSSMAMKKSRSKYEYERHISIAQVAVDWMKGMKIDMRGTRAHQIQEAGQTVAEWAKGMEPQP